MTSFNSIAVIGAGAWGTALAGVAARAGRNVILCAHSRETAEAIAAARSNPKLPGITLHANIEVTDDVARGDCGSSSQGARRDPVRARFCR
jgi:glycerol-3-phosphate dehydrogenase (NAD(P)+)